VCYAKIILYTVFAWLCVAPSSAQSLRPVAILGDESGSFFLGAGIQISSDNQYLYGLSNDLPNNPDSLSVKSFSIDQQSGLLTEIDQELMECDATSITSTIRPTRIQMAPNGNFLYVPCRSISIGEGNPDTVFVYQRDPFTGQLTLINVLTTPMAFLITLTLSPDGRNLYIIAEDAGPGISSTLPVYVYDVDQNSGAINLIQTIEVMHSEGFPINSIFVSIDGKHVYVNRSRPFGTPSGLLTILSRNDSGILTDQQTMPFPLTQTFADPVFTEDGLNVYFNSGNYSEPIGIGFVVSAQRDPSTGIMTVIQEDRSNELGTTKRFLITSDERLLISANDNINAYRILEDGKVALAGTGLYESFPEADNPRFLDVVLTPNQRFLYVPFGGNDALDPGVALFELIGLPVQVPTIGGIAFVVLVVLFLTTGLMVAFRWKRNVSNQFSLTNGL